jgi:hypothetical protein
VEEVMAAIGKATGDQWRHAGREPTIEQVLADPLLHLVMERDGVSLMHLRAVIIRAQVALRSRLCCGAAA